MGSVPLRWFAMPYTGYTEAMRNAARSRTTGASQLHEAPRRVWVTGRSDIGEVIDPAKVIGHRPTLLCVGVHFPETGEVVYYDASRVFDVE